MKNLLSNFCKLLFATCIISLTSLPQTILLDELDGSTLGNAVGLTYTTTPNGLGAIFNYQSESKIEYGFDTQIPRQGTLELVIKVESGYVYANYTFYPNFTYAQIFGTDCDGGDVYWPGAMILRVENNGKITLITHTAYVQPQSTFLVASNTNFRYNQWHKIGISYGSQGQFINLDGEIVSFDTSYTLPMSATGTFAQPTNKPTIGELTSSFWQHNQYDGGFNGIVDRFRTSSLQKDWLLTITDIENEGNSIGSFILTQNYPNPFNPQTTISYSLPQTEFVLLKVYDVLGKEVATLVNEEKSSGNYSVKFDGSNLASGIYFCKLQTNQFTDVKKLTLIK